ncbi:uncharacterized protein CCR75_006815 [Bremia lactucae]|uniref:Uncharacterized protein n=1 Tax=Bremia lactucae TaxID=4779 RepID=A0A976IB01_BRELC|nr:hypothetical protein CCR75_006815 [Bremia lactucae]
MVAYFFACCASFASLCGRWREQDPEDADDFDKREMENCVPHDIRSSVVGSRAVVEWATRRTYIRKVKLQKANDHFTGLINPWRSCHDVAAHVEVRYRRLGDNDTVLVIDGNEELFLREKAVTYTAEGATLTSHTASIDLPLKYLGTGVRIYCRFRVPRLVCDASSGE